MPSSPKSTRTSATKAASATRPPANPKRRPKPIGRRQRLSPTPPSVASTPLGRLLRALAEHPGRGRGPTLALPGRRDQLARARDSARPGPWRLRARSPPPAPAAAPAPRPPPCARRARPRSTPRRGRSRASRRRPRADPLAAPLLRRHVFDRADDRGAAARHRTLAVGLCEAEIGEVGALSLDQDVVRLDVAVDDAGGMGGVERVGDLAQEADRPGGRAAGPRDRSACAGPRPRPGASRRSARRPPRGRRRRGRRRGGRGLAASRDSRRKRSRKASSSARSRAITFSATGRSSADWVAR